MRRRQQRSTRTDRLYTKTKIVRTRQCLAAGVCDRVSRAVDRAGQLGGRIAGLGGDDDIGAIARCAHGNGQPDTARSTGDEQRLAFQAHWMTPWVYMIFFDRRIVAAINAERQIPAAADNRAAAVRDRQSTRLNSSH